YDVVITVENKELKLKPGMTANVNIEVMRKDDVLMVPSAALRFKPVDTGETAKQQASSRRSATGTPLPQKVFVLEDGKAVPIPVKSGISDDSHVEIVAGKLRAGQAVIIEQVLSKKKTDQVGRMGPRF
ncbi:MAG: efflux RND transporter periplasmic adaptor subunit, partial [Geobacteraceae bacterium]